MTTPETRPEPEDREPADVPSMIRPHHRERLAVDYIRQSSVQQVRDHIGSTEAQRDLAAQARRWGWPESLIRIIDDDLGLSGTSSEQRGGFQELLALMQRGEVGLVLVRDVARISREPLDAERFLDAAIRHDVLIEAHGRLHDPSSRDVMELFGYRVQALLAWWENAQRVRTMVTAKLAKIALGLAVSRPPIGYVWAEPGKWAKDPDPDVQLFIREVFRLYLECRSIRKAAVTLRERNVRFPRRRGGQTEWLPPADVRIIHVLYNPAYTGDYFYGRHAVQRTATGDRRCSLRPESAWLVARDHHPAYISREEWRTIQELLHGRGSKRGRRPAAGQGSALLQGRIACGLCGQWMRTIYSNRDREHGRAGTYLCRRCDMFGKTRHRLSVYAKQVDGFIVRQVLGVLAPPSLETALLTINEDQTQSAAAERSRRRQLDRLEDRVEDLKRQFQDVHSEHRHLKIDLQADLNTAIRERNEMRTNLENRAQEPAETLPPADATQLIALAGDLEAVWQAPTTTNEERKHIIGLAINKIVVMDATAEAIELEIEWVNGVRERHRLPGRDAVDRQIEAMGRAGEPVKKSVEVLRAADVLSRRGQPYTSRTLGNKLRRFGCGTKVERLTALRKIRPLLLAGRSRREILALLKTEGPQPQDGEWTLTRIATAIRSIRQCRWGAEVPPLPAAGRPAPRPKRQG
jgi:DNA invertase Pin-like site-specific DNA recombinase